VRLSNWSERQTYFLARFYDLETQLLLRAAVRPGDCVIDGGANIGMITLLASHLVGSSGRVIAFEPNPAAAARLRSALDRNRIGNVTLHELALGAEDGTSVLRVVTEHSGMGTLADLPPDQVPLVSASYEVRVARGAQVLDDLPESPLTIKLDVEGYELAALTGLRPVLAVRRPLVVTEVIEELLRRAGASAEALGAFMAALGYVPHAIQTRRSGMTRRPVLRRLPRAEASGSPNIAWLQDGTEHHSRLAGILVR
jgi:FkbM family methyltransferase